MARAHLHEISPAERLVNELFTEPAKALLRDKAPVRQDGSPAAFNERSLDVLALDFANRLEIYLNTKGRPYDQSAPRPEDIDTGHPISNILTPQAIIRDCIVRMLAAKTRTAYAETMSPVGTKEKYKDENSYNVLYAWKILVEIRRHQIMTSHQGKAELSSIFEYALNTKEMTGQLPEDLHKHVTMLLTRELMYPGLATQVVSLQTQREMAHQKALYLEASPLHIRVEQGRRALVRGEGEQAVSVLVPETDADRANARANALAWLDGDKDGDQNVNYWDVLHQRFGDSLDQAPFQDIVAYMGEYSKSRPPIQARRADVKKKGVAPISVQLQELLKGLDIANVNDVLNPRKREELIKKLLELRYDMGDRTTTATNIPLDFVLDLLSEVRKGFVISDFPSDCEKARSLLLGLTFLSSVVNELQGSKPQIFLPLCEDKESIEGLDQVVNGFYQEILDQIDAINRNPSLNLDQKNAEIIKFLSLFVNERGHFVVGVFPGPSDLTKRMGSTSHFEMVNAIAKSELAFHAFKETIQQKLSPEVIDQLEVDTWSVLKQYGHGTALRRGGAVLPLGRTRQGVAASASRQIDKIWHVLAQTGDMSIKNLGALQRYVQEHKDFVEAAAQAHNSFFDSSNPKEPGKVVNWYNKVRHDPLMEILLKPHLNPSGNRGIFEPSAYTAASFGHELPPASASYKLNDMENTRAIEAAAAHMFLGVLGECSFPLTMTEMKKTIPNLGKFIEQPLGLKMVMTALTQMVIVDNQRAKLLECPPEVLHQTNVHLYEVACYLAQELNVGMTVSFEEFRDNIEARLEIACQLVGAIESQALIIHPDLKKCIELFKIQLPLMTKMNKHLTQQMVELHALLDEGRLEETRKPEYTGLKQLALLLKPCQSVQEEKNLRINLQRAISNTAFAVNELANFMSSPLQTMLNVEACQKKEPVEVVKAAAADDGPGAAHSGVKRAQQYPNESYWTVRAQLLEAAAGQLRQKQKNIS